jgi:3-hydroxy-3-methylglutaryl CoA synthase
VRLGTWRQNTEEICRPGTRDTENRKKIDYVEYKKFCKKKEEKEERKKKEEREPTDRYIYIEIAKTLRWAWQ